MVKSALNKKGFSMAEALVSMLVVSIFFLATTKVMTQRQQPETQQNLHGFYECYVIRSGSGPEPVFSLKQQKALEQNDPVEQSVTKCKLDPPKGIAFAVIYSIAGKDADDSSVEEEAKVNRIYKSVEPQFNREFTIDSVAALQEFHSTEMGVTEADDITTADFANFLQQSYPKSKLYQLIKNGTYNEKDPALFVGW